MKRLFSLDGPVGRILNTAADLMALNLLWLVCSIPIVTAGAAATAGYHSCFRLVRGEGNLVRAFFRSFRRNLRQATLGWLLFSAAALGFFADYSLLLPLAFPGKPFVVAGMALLALLCAFTCLYFFPLLAQFENTLPNTARNALLLSLRFLPRTLLMALPAVLVFWLAIWHTGIFLRLGIFWLLFLFSLPAYLHCRLLQKVFQPYLDESGD